MVFMAFLYMKSCFQGLLFNYGRILCMQPLGGQRMALGTQLGKVWLLDTKECKIMHSSMQLEDAVLCMNLYRLVCFI